MRDPSLELLERAMRDASTTHADEDDYPSGPIPKWVLHKTRRRIPVTDPPTKKDTI